MKNVPNDADSDAAEPYIAARFDRLPSDFALGDGRMYGSYRNKRLEKGESYRVFVRAYTNNVSCSRQ